MNRDTEFCTETS